MSASMMLDEGGGCGLFPSLLFELPAEPIRAQYSRVAAAAAAAGDADVAGPPQQLPTLPPPAGEKPPPSSSIELQAPCLLRQHSTPVLEPGGGVFARDSIVFSPLPLPPPSSTISAPSLLGGLEPAQLAVGDDSKVQLKHSLSLTGTAQR